MMPGRNRRGMRQIGENTVDKKREELDERREERTCVLKLRERDERRQ